jgi:hypothetical protein
MSEFERIAEQKSVLVEALEILLRANFDYSNPCIARRERGVHNCWVLELILPWPVDGSSLEAFHFPRR